MNPLRNADAPRLDPETISSAFSRREPLLTLRTSATPVQSEASSRADLLLETGPARVLMPLSRSQAQVRE